MTIHKLLKIFPNLFKELISLVKEYYVNSRKDNYNILVDFKGLLSKLATFFNKKLLIEERSVQLNFLYNFLSLYPCLLYFLFVTK